MLPPVSESNHSYQQRLPKPGTGAQDPPPSVETVPLRCEPNEKDMRRQKGISSLYAMSMRQALETFDSDQLSELSPVMLASMSKAMWSTIKTLTADANRWRLMRRRACLLDRRMLDGPYRMPGVESKQAAMDVEDSVQPQERLAMEMDSIVEKWTVVPYSHELKGPDDKKEHVADSANFYVEHGRVYRLQEAYLQPGQRRWEKEISAQLLLYRLCILFQTAPTIESGAWLFIVRSLDGAEVWFADKGNMHWFLAVCPDRKACDSVTELLELLISDRCVIRYGSDPSMQHPTAGETIGAAWSR